MILTNLAQLKREGLEALKATNPNIATSKDLNLIRFHHLRWTITYKDNTTNDVTAPVKRLAAPTVETRLLRESFHTQTPVAVTGAEPGLLLSCTIMMMSRTAVADASGQADRNTECSL